MIVKANTRVAEQGACRGGSSGRSPRVTGFAGATTRGFMRRGSGSVDPEHKKARRAPSRRSTGRGKEARQHTAQHERKNVYGPGVPRAPVSARPYAPDMSTEAGFEGTSAGAQEVAAAAKESWRVAGHHADVVPWDSFVQALGLELDRTVSAAVVVPTERLVECVFDAGAVLQEAMGNFSALVSDGWHVNAILPTRCMGEAHQAWRGLDIQLQGWWNVEGRGLRFTAPELP